jgi:hypothetical protein
MDYQLRKAKILLEEEGFWVGLWIENSVEGLEGDFEAEGCVGGSFTVD